MTITHRIVVISGATQGTGRVTGCQRLYSTLREELASTTCDVRLYGWRLDVDDLADEIVALAEGEPPRIDIAGYSWGGMTAVNLCRSLDGRGLPVHGLVLCDAVYRSQWFGLYWRSMSPWPTIWIPGNISNVVAYYQRENRPSGHALRWDDGTRVSDRYQLGAKHEHMDDQPRWHKEMARMCRLRLP